LADIHERISEIEQLIAANELNTATKRVMDFASDFGSAHKKEAINLRRRYNELREEKRQIGSSADVDRKLTQLCDSLLGFLEHIQEQSAAESPAAPEMEQPLAAVPTPRNQDSAMESVIQLTAADKAAKTPLEQEKEAFLQRRIPAPPEAPRLVFHGKDIQKKYSGRGKKFSFSLPELTLKPGEITAVVGENGNGKTTLLRIIAGQLQIDAGTLTYPLLTGKDPNDWYTIKQQIAYIPQDLPRWSGLLADNLHFSASIHGITGAKNEEEVDFIVNRLGLEQYREMTWGQISGGYRMRFALARALIWDPALLILDEPLANLDINTQTIFLRDLRYLADSSAYPKTIIISSQHLHSVEDIADNILFIQDGTARYNGKMQDFGQEREENSFEFACKLSKEDLSDLLEAIPTHRLEEVGYYFLLDTPVSVSANDLLALFVDHKVKMHYFRDISKSTRKLFKLEQ